MAKIDRKEGRTLFGLDPAAYDRARPDYPDRVYEILHERCGLTASARVLEIGAGSGNVTRKLLEIGTGAIVAVEPDEAMAKYLKSTAPEVDVRVEAIEDSELPAGSFDLAIAATVFHWVDPEVAYRQVADALRPGGWWAMWWNNFGDPQKEDAFHEATVHLLESLPQSPSVGDAGRPPFSLDVEARMSELSAAGFQNIGSEIFHWTLVLSPAETRALYATYGSINLIESVDRTKLLDDIAQIAEEEFGGRVERHMNTPVYTAQKLH